MTRIVHLSDLHFGRDDPDRIAPLAAAVRRLTPDLVAVSGDLTQRARVSQFEEARAFLDSLTLPTLVVPGNHDVPLDEPLVRLFSPWRRYRETISPNLEPSADFEESLILGFNTVNRFVWQSGRLSLGARRRLARRVAGAGKRTLVAVLHHPLEQVSGRTGFRGRSKAIRALAEAGADVVLSGHLHTSRLSPLSRDSRLLMIQAGTALSDRRRDEENAFNLVNVGCDSTSVVPHIWRDGDYRATARSEFEMTGDGWRQSM